MWWARIGTTQPPLRQNGRMLLHELVDTSVQVSSTRRRSEKVALLADLFSDMAVAEIPVVVGALSGEPRQGKIGIGYRTVAGIHTPSVAQPELSVLDIDAAFEQISATGGSGSQADRVGILESLLGRCTEAEQGFVKRLLTGGIRQGALVGVMTDAVARAAGVAAGEVRRAFMMWPDLGRVAEIAMTGGRDGLAGVGLEVMRPIAPMLAKTAKSAAAAIESEGLSSVEWKLDGVRIQVHRSGSRVRIFTRNLNDVTDRLVDVVNIVCNLAADQLVLDGEVMTLTADGKPRPFVETMSRVGTEEPSAKSSGAVPFFFDVLHEGGRDLVDFPLSDRYTVLDRVVPTEYRIPRVTTDDPIRAEAVLADARAQGHEGIMVKRVDSTYEAGRRGATWLKVKPAHTLDLVVLAVEWGSGRRTGWLSNIHLGARDPTTGDFVMLGKTFKGMTDEMLEWQTERFLELETHRDEYVVYVRPEQVVEVAFDGIQASTRYPGGMALRFARVKGYREDKNAEEADTIDAVRSVFDGA